MESNWLSRIASACRSLTTACRETGPRATTSLSGSDTESARRTATRDSQVDPSLPLAPFSLQRELAGLTGTTPELAPPSRSIKSHVLPVSYSMDSTFDVEDFPAAGTGLPQLCEPANMSATSSPASPTKTDALRTQYDPFIIAVAGGTASGKTTVCDLIIQRLHDQCCVLINQDSFYKVLTEDEKRLANMGKFNFDSPSAIDEDTLLHCIDQLRKGNGYDVPIYDFSTHARSSKSRHVDPAQVIIVEGILALHFESILERAHMKVFVDSDDDVRLARRIKRDVAERGRDVAGVIEQYTKFVKPAHDEYIAPSRRVADIVVPWQRGDSNYVAVDLIVGHLKSHIVKDVLCQRFDNLHLLESTFQLRGMHTIMRNRDTEKGEFIFMADRLIRLVVEYALGLLPTVETNVITHTTSVYPGLRISAKVCGVSVIRSGESMEGALRTCWKGIGIGKILVYRSHHHIRHLNGGTMLGVTSEDSPRTQGYMNEKALSTDMNGTFYSGSVKSHMSSSGVPAANPDDLVYEKLPHDIAHRMVLLMDPILGTGQTACRAIKVLQSKGVEESNILFLTLIASRQGIAHVCSRHPTIKVITTEIDHDLDPHCRVIPGIGEFGDRYFCA